MTVILKNNAFGFLQSAISNSDTAIVLQSGFGANFPNLSAGEYFYATISPTAGASEIVKVGARSGDTLTIVRAQEGTSALAFPAGSRTELRVTAQSVIDAIDDRVATKDQASEISFAPTGGITAIDVQSAVAEVDSKKASLAQLAASSGAALVGFAPTGGITAIDVQSAVAEVDSKKASLAQLAASSGAALVGFQQSGTGAVTRTVDGKLKEMPSALDFGADPTGITDSTLAIQAFINAGGGYLPPGTYNVSSTLVLKNRITIDGPKDSWSPAANRNAIIKWVGAAGGNVVQASTTAIGTPATNALTSVRLQNITIDGDNVAGVGLFINYASNESVFNNVTVIKCSIGIVAGKLWYCRLSNLTARNCSAMGMHIGAQYLGSFDIPQVNSLRMDNLRASNCGSRYDASTNPFGFGSANLRGGCGIYLNLNSGNFATQVTSENNYGPGLVFGGSYSNSINGIYLESNTAGAVADGEIAKPYGLVLIGFPQGGTKAINTLFMHPANANIYVDDVSATSGIFVIDAANYIEAIDSASGTNRLIKILNPEMIAASNVGYPLQNAEKTATAFDATYEGTVNTATNSASLRNSRTTIKAFAKQFDWASASTLTVCTINVDCGGQTAGSAGSLLLNINIGTGIAGTSYDSHSFTYLVSFAAWQRDAALVVANVNTDIVQLGTVREHSATLLSNLTLSAVVTVTATSRATIELQLTPTSTGTQVRNSVSASAVFLSGGLASIGRPSRIV